MPHHPTLPAGVSAEDIRGLAVVHGARNPRVFGSRSNGSARPDSDLDLLVDLEPGRDLFDLIDLKHALEDLLGLRVDVVTEPGLPRRIREQVLRGARPL